MLAASRCGKKKIDISIVHRSVSRGHLAGCVLMALLWLLSSPACLAAEAAAQVATQATTRSTGGAVNPDAAAVCPPSGGQPLSLSLGRGPVRLWVPVADWRLFASCSADFGQLAPEEREAIHAAWLQCRQQRQAEKTSFQRIDRTRSGQVDAVRHYGTRPAFDFYRCVRNKVVSRQSSVGS